MNLRILFLAGFLMASLTAQAGADWIGDSQVSQINWHNYDGRCGAIYKCMSIYFKEPYRNCAYIAIRVDEPRIKSIESMALISMTTGKKFRVYGSTEFCGEAGKIGINDFGLH